MGSGLRNTMSDFQLANPAHEAARRDLLQRYGRSDYRCAQFTREFQKQFPELQRVAGFYFSADSDVSYGEHWWLVAPDGPIVDPTADQFPCQGTGRYVRYDARVHTVVKGKCMNCGTGLYTREGSYPCSKSCAEDLSRTYGIRVADGPFEDEMTFECDADITENYGIQFSTPF